MAITHSTVVTADNVATDEVSKNAWNAEHTIDLTDTIVNADISASAAIAGTKVEISSGVSVTTNNIKDIVGAMVANNTETGIAVTYDATEKELNFEVTATGGTYTPVTTRPTATTDLLVYCFVEGTTPNRIWWWEFKWPGNDTPVVMNSINET